MSTRSSAAVLILLAGFASCGLPSRPTSLEMLPDVNVLPALAPFQGDGFDGTDFSSARALNGRPNEAFQRSFDEAIATLASRRDQKVGVRRSYDMLVLSSGGVNGAYGAGVLTGWSRTGDRPDFEIVTGVSVGALLAPFAFAGPEFDDRLEKLFRLLQPEDLHEEKSPLTAAIWDESLLDNEPLVRRIEEGIDMRILEAIAEAHKAGRRLYVGTTFLDFGRFVVWDMGEIATARNQDALFMFRKVLAASASIPVAYPPVRFATDNDENVVEEMHVDGAVVRPLFLPEGIFDGFESARRAGVSWDDVDASMYVITNGALKPEYHVVQRDTFDIAMRSIMMMSYTLVGEDILHLYLLSKLWGAEFNFVAVDAEDELSVADFSSLDTNRMYKSGQSAIMREKAKRWCHEPPGYIVGGDLARVTPIQDSGEDDPDASESAPDAASTTVTEQPSVSERLDRIEAMLESIQRTLPGSPSTAR